LTCEIRPSRDGFDLICTQDGEHHIEHFALESQAWARGISVEKDLISDGWSVVRQSGVSAHGSPQPDLRLRLSQPASDDSSAR